MSTLDSILHSNMTILTHDIYRRYVRLGAGQAHYLQVGRLFVVLLLARTLYVLEPRYRATPASDVACSPRSAGQPSSHGITARPVASVVRVNDRRTSGS